jgi:ribonuclease-3
MLYQHLISKFISRFSRRRSESFNFAAIEKIIHYQFKNRQLLHTAFLHRSFLTGSKHHSAQSNERLEFLGDAVLDLVVTEFLYKSRPSAREGELSKVKSVLVSRNVLAEMVSKMKLAPYLLINRGEEKTGGRQRTSNLSNLYESLLGAIYLDGGLSAARTFIDRSLIKWHKKLLNHQDFINYKSILLEYAQKYGPKTPVYHLVEESGPDHDKQFEMEVSIGGSHQAKGSGKSKKLAEQAAAHNLIKQIAPQLLDEQPLPDRE